MLTTIQSPQELIQRTKELLHNRSELSKEDFKKQASWLINNAKRFGMHYELKSILADEPIRQTKTAAEQEEFPVRNRTELQKAIQWFMRYRHQLPYEKRRKLACKLLKKASEYEKLPTAEQQILEKSQKKIKNLAIETHCTLLEPVALKVALISFSKYAIAMKHILMKMQLFHGFLVEE